MKDDMRIVIEASGLPDFVKSLREMPTSVFLGFSFTAAVLFACFFVLAMIG